MDIQVILVFILAILTINLVVVGFYLVLILKDFRETIKKANVVLDDVHSVTDIVSNPVSTLTAIVSSVVKGFKATKSVSSLVDFGEKPERKSKRRLD